VQLSAKNVLAKCYGGDHLPQTQLLENKKKAEAHDERVGQVDIPQEAFSPS